MSETNNTPLEPNVPVESKNPSRKSIFKSKKAPVVAGLVFLALIVIVGIAISVTTISDNAKKEKELQTIVIGDTTITPQDVKDYAQILRDSVSSVGGSFDESEDTIALKALVLNAALKKEAKDNGVTVSDLDIIKETTDQPQTPEEIKKAVSEFRSKDKTYIIGYENLAYKKALDDKLIKKLSLLVVQSNFDTPYYKSVSEDKIPTLYEPVLNRLNNEIAPLVKNGVSADEIAKKVDFNVIKNNKTDSEIIKLYSSQGVVAVQKIEDYAPGTRAFNDLEETDYIVGDVGQLYNTDEKLAELKNVGDSTEVFASKSGLFMIARLDAANGGQYNSWEDFLQKYIDNNVKYAGIDIAKFVANVQSLGVKAVDKAIVNLTEPGLEKADAAGYVCSQHTVRYRVAIWVGGPGGGPGSVDANPSVGFTPQPNGCVGNPDAGDGRLSKGEQGNADCMQEKPNWGSVQNVQSPSGNFKYKGVYWDLLGGGPWSSRADRAFPTDPPWTPGTANATSSATNYIWFVYEPDSGPTLGALKVSLQTWTDANCTIYGIATFRPPGTNGSADIRTPWNISGGYTYPPGGGSYAGANAYRVGGDPRRLVIPVSNPAGVFPNGGGKNFTLSAQYTYQGVPYTASVTEYIVPPQPFGCNPPPDYGTELSQSAINGGCSGVNIFARDRNGTSGYTLSVYHTGLGGAPVYQESGAVSSTGLSKAIPLNLPPAPNSNNGYYYQLDVYQIGIYGNITGVSSTNFSTGACYSATCTTSITPNVPGASGNAVEANKQFRVTYNITENGRLRVPAGSLSLTLWPLPTPAFPGLSGPTPHYGASGSFMMTAPDTVAASTLNFYPDWYGMFPINAGNPQCPVTVEIYKPFNIEPRAGTITLTPDDENPNSVTFISTAEKTIPTPTPDVPGIVVRRAITKNGTDFQTFTSTDTLGNRTYTDSATISSSQLGDKYCGYITVTPSTGYIGPSNKRVDVPPGNSKTDRNNRCNPSGVPPPPTTEVVNKPYVKVYGGDVVAGAGFISGEGDCSSPSSDILAFMRPLNEQNTTANKSGSGGQLGVFAWGEVRGFASAAMRTSSPSSTGANKLTFSNDVSAPSSTAQDALLGGSLTTPKICQPDYFNETQYNDDSTFKKNGIGGSVSLNSSAITTKEQTLYNSNLTITASTGYAKRHTIYVNGDVAITGNITYTPGPYADVKDIPNFTLVVLGNIYVSRTVTQLDGTYIAQPDPEDASNTGRIYTCSNGFTPLISSSQMFNSCGASGGVSQLNVKGSFISDKLVLNRTVDTLRDSRYRETPANTKAAEVFTFSPDVYLSPPVFKPKSTVTSGDYQYIATLPPIL